MNKRGREATAGKSGPSTKYAPTHPRYPDVRRLEHQPFLHVRAIYGEFWTCKIQGDGLTPRALILAFNANDLPCG